MPDRFPIQETFDERRRRMRAEHDKLEKQAKGCFSAFALIWVFSLVIGVAFLALIGWGIVELIQYLQRH